MRCISHIVTPEFEESLKTMTFQEITDLMEISRQNIVWHPFNFKPAVGGLWLIAEKSTSGVHLETSDGKQRPAGPFMHAGPFTEDELKQPWLQATMVGPSSRVKRYNDPADKEIWTAGEHTTWWKHNH